MRRKSKALYWIYALTMAALVIWLCRSTPYIAGRINGSSVRKAEFEELRAAYLKDLVYYVAESDADYIRYDGGLLERFAVSGWAFCDTKGDTSNRHVSLVLRSNKDTYEFIPYLDWRGDVPLNVPKQLNRPDMKITQNTGYYGRFSLLDMKDGAYDLYLCCWENETNHGMADTLRQIVKNGSDVQIMDWSTLPLDESIRETQEVQSVGYLDGVTVKESRITVSGWEFVPDQDTFDQRVYVEITDSSGNKTQYPAKMITRQDVSELYDNPLYAQSGYITVFQDDNFKDDLYTVRVFIENGGEIWQSKQYTVLKDKNGINVFQWPLQIAAAMNEPVEATQTAQSLGYLDSITLNGDMVTAFGWEFVPDMDTREQKVYVELADSSGNKAQYPAKTVTRQDVSDLYGNPLYTQSGYRMTFRNDRFADGSYTVRVFVQNGGEVWMSKPYTVIKTGKSVEVRQY